AGPQEGFDYEGGYQEGKSNVGVNEATGQYHGEIKGLKEPESEEAGRICREDLNEVITAFVQDKAALEHGLFDQENALPEALPIPRRGRIVRDRDPEWSEAAVESVRQHAVAALDVTPHATRELDELREDDRDGGEDKGNLALIHGVRK